MNESFSQLFKESLKVIETRPGSIIQGRIVSIDKDVVLVDSGLKSESTIPIDQFKSVQGEIAVQIGDYVDVALDAVEDGFGETLLSREKAKKRKAWLMLEKSHDEASSISGIINGKVKGGFTVEINGIRAFLPGSLVDIRPVRESAYLENKELEFKVIKLDQKRNNVVVSRKAVIESENNADREELLKKLKEGAQVQGIIKNLTDYGAFVDLGGIDGLLHITDMAWKRVKNPSEIVSLGEEITVKILKFDRVKNRVSLGLKQLGNDPWQSITTKYPHGMKIKGRVTNLTDYGCFVEIEEGVEGLVHISEMDWTNKNIHPSKVVSIDEITEVAILDINEERRRISLGIKQCKSNPWESFAKNYKKGGLIKGRIKSITDFGIFVGLMGGIDGLVHLSDISWDPVSEETMQFYKKGDEISAVVLQVDPERERISLGVKQLSEDPLSVFFEKNKNKNIEAEVISIDSKKEQILLNIQKNIQGCLRSNQKKIRIGQMLQVKVIGIDRKSRMVLLFNVSNLAENEHQSKAKIPSNDNKSNQT